MKRILLTFIIGLFWGVLGVDAFAQGRSSLEYDVKAAFLYNFASFVEWPRLSFNGPNAPLKICIFGRDPFDGALVRLVQGEPVAGHPRVIEQTEDIEQLKNCHIAFIGSSEQEELRAVLDSLRGLPVLTIGETPGFLQAGGIINFAIERNRVRFDINLARADQASLKISSKLLRLARTTRLPPPLN